MFSADLRYLSSFLTLTVPDVDAAADWYQGAFGFAAIAAGVDDGRAWRHVRRAEGQDFVLVGSERDWETRVRALSAGGRGVLRLRVRGRTPHLAVDRDLSEVTSLASAAGARVVRRPRKPRKDVRAVTLRDPYGYEWVFFSRLP
jgi:catechol 2,3-dioxygenase-like lactoylglutathione lyase family enzyme